MTTPEQRAEWRAWAESPRPHGPGEVAGDRILALLDDLEAAELELATEWDEGYSTCLGDFDIAARHEARSVNPHKTALGIGGD